MELPKVTAAEWRAAVENELAGKPFEKALVQQTPEGIAIEPLYTELPLTLPLRDPAPQPFRICVRAGPQPLLEIEDGVDALWVYEVTPELRQQDVFFLLESDELPPPELLSRVALVSDDVPLDPQRVARFVREHEQAANLVMIPGYSFHEGGADAADELAAALSMGARALRGLIEAGLPAGRAARQLWVQLSAGRDTFLELCKFRAFRTVWRKLLTAAGAPDAPRTLVQAICSDRAVSARDPWVNMLRVTTQMFAAILGGADLVTPQELDRGALTGPGRRLARNTGLILREESMLGKVQDPAGGSYAFETLTDQLARSAWARFQEVEQEGGLDPKYERRTRLDERVSAYAAEQRTAFAKRKIPILGLSEFANLDEKLPHRAPPQPDGDGYAFEELRLTADAIQPPPALLVTLGPLADSRARAGFAANFFAAGGIRSRETNANEKALIACLCGTDERYAAEAADRARALKAAGCKRVLVAGRPGDLEKPLREAGVDGFIYMGCDAVATLRELLDVKP